MLASKLTVFSHGRDGHQPKKNGFILPIKRSSLIRGGMTIPNIRSLDPGIYIYIYYLEVKIDGTDTKR